MRDVARTQNFIQRFRAFFKTIIVLIAAIKINFQTGEIRLASQGDRAIPFPECRIGRRPERFA